MSATYGWKPVVPQKSTSFNLMVADALASYFGCERHELGDNCTLDRSDINSLRMLEAMARGDSVDEIREIIAAIEKHGEVALTVGW